MLLTLSLYLIIKLFYGFKQIYSNLTNLLPIVREDSLSQVLSLS
jgi:hypothetical protein